MYITLKLAVLHNIKLIYFLVLLGYFKYILLLFHYNIFDAFMYSIYCDIATFT